MEDLKEVDPKVKETPPTSEEKGVEPTSPEVKPTSRTYTQKELDEAVGKGRASTQSQLSLQKAEASKAKAEAEQHKATVSAIEADLQDLQGQHDELVSQQFADDPEARKAYVSKRSIAEDRRKLTKEKVEVERKLYDAEKLAWSAGMARKADALVRETGIDTGELESCQTEEEMEVKALRFKMDKEPSEEAKEPKFDTDVSSGGSGKLTVEQVKNMSPEERATRSKEIAEMPLGLGLK